MKRMILALTGASGSAYFVRLLEFLAEQEAQVHVVASAQGERVLPYETGETLDELLHRLRGCKATIVREDNEDLFSKIASGSYRCDAMVIVPCSMNTLAEIANGLSRTLLTRAADVMIKERRTLLIVPRETPFSAIHLKNMLTLAELGASVLPAMPGFYGRPQTVTDCIDFVVGKILDGLGIQNELFVRWKGQIE